MLKHCSCKLIFVSFHFTPCWRSTWPRWLAMKTCPSEPLASLSCTFHLQTQSQTFGTSKMQESSPEPPQEFFQSRRDCLRGMLPSCWRGAFCLQGSSSNHHCCQTSEAETLSVSTTALGHGRQPQCWLKGCHRAQTSTFLVSRSF